jgi:predicted enzyme related to lactoylglutathione lyase
LGIRNFTPPGGAKCNHRGEGRITTRRRALSEKSEYAPGTPSWVDVSVPDPDAAADFYSAIFGWEIHDAGDPEETGGYRMATLGDKYVAGIGPIQGEGQPPSWTTYVSTDDADATAAKVKEAGGMVFAEPFDVMEAGRMAVFADPTGAVFAVWEAKQHPGAQVVNEPGTFGWNELNTRDPEAAKAFYGSVFGWRGQKFDNGGGPDYATWHLGENDNGVGGLIDMRGAVPDEVPPHWLVYFNVDDTDATIDQVKERGGDVAFGPEEIPNVGRFAVLTDQQGAHFAVIKVQPPSDASADEG